MDQIVEAFGVLMRQNSEKLSPRLLRVREGGHI